MTDRPTPIPTTADTLNQHCYCRTLSRELLREELESHAGVPGLMDSITQTRPHLFSSTVVFLSGEMADRIAQTIAAIERVAALSAYQAQALARAPAVAHHNFGPIGACMGYDFHLSPTGPRLIEINTNAGGALLNVALARAQQSCCEAMDLALGPVAPPDTLEAEFFEMFMAEWRRQRGDMPLRTVLIVDDAPDVQYLAPEFALFQHLFERHGVTARISDPAGLTWREGVLWHGEQAVDLVYNRLTDFYLAEPGHEALRLAFEAGAVVLTPDPRAHALWADKRNLVVLSQDEVLAGWGVSPEDRRLLSAVVPSTRLVTPEQAEDLWAQRRHLFFKPVAGYGAKAAYRGDKLTRRVWSEILAGDFVAQALVPPAQRLIEVDGVLSDLKFDLRAYTYAGRVQLMAARMYTGQTTNFRTEGGGFAPVVVLPADGSRAL
ncbi:MAG: hypothetical protein Q8K22_00445 [Rhodoferax sp.]|nr:hypothetical protein [Rhodoferax sp.]